MKKLYFLLIGSAFANTITSQIQTSAIDYLDTNNVRAAILCNADFGWDLSNSQYEVPKGSGKHPLYTGSLWIGGYHNGQLRMAANTYRQNGMDFWPGPLDLNTGSITVATSNQWNKLWKVTKTQVDKFKQEWIAGNVQSGTYVPPPEIMNWPGNGSGNQAQNLAWYYDMNSDGIYNPLVGGDYPYMMGDQMIFYIINDALAPHTETGAPALGVEIHCYAYSYNRPCAGPGADVLNNTIFYNYKIYNRSPDVLDSTTVGFFIDSDLGSSFDDYVGCDVKRNIAFTYNATDAVYGAKPPAFSILTLKGPIADLGDNIDNNRDSCIDCTWLTGPNCTVLTGGAQIPDGALPEYITMSSFKYLDNTVPAYSGGIGYYNMINSKWGNGTNLTYGSNGTVVSNPACKFAFPGNSDLYGWGLGYQPGSPPMPAQGPSWTEHNLARTPGERKMYIGLGKFTFQPNSEQDVNIALIFSRDTAVCTNNLCALGIAQQNADTIRRFFKCNLFPTCASANEIAEINKNNFKIYPNPTYNYLNLEFTQSQQKQSFEIVDILGNIVKTGILNESQNKISLNVEDLTKGVYTIKLKLGDSFGVRKFVKE